jgi:hypothetical protein
VSASSEIVVDVRSVFIRRSSPFILDVPVGTVRSLVARARRKLLPLLAEYAPDVAPHINEIFEEQDVTSPAMTRFLQEVVADKWIPWGSARARRERQGPQPSSTRRRRWHRDTLTRSCVGAGDSSPKSTTARRRGVPVAGPPSRIPPRSSCAWRPKIRPGATHASAAG